MAFKLIDSVSSAIPAELLDKASGIIGESPQATQRGFHAGLSSIAGGISSQAKTPEGARQLFSTMKDNGYLSGDFDPAGIYGRGGGGLDQAMSKGQGLLGSLFGGRTNGMVDEVARSSGIGVGAASKLMALGAPLVLGVLGRKVGSGGIAGLTQLMHGGTERFVEPTRTKREVLMPVGDRSRWGRLLVPIAVVLALFAGLNWLRNRPGKTEATKPEVTGQAEPKQAEPTTPAPPEEQPQTAQAPEATTPPEPPVAEEPGTGGAGAPTKPMFLNESASDLKGALTSDSALPQTFILKGVEFNTGSAALSGGAKSSLDNVAGILRQYPDAKITVEGHADATGEPAKNEKLSTDRAAAVKDALVQRGVSADQLSTDAKSSDEPMASNASPQGRSENRLAHIVLTER